MKRARIRVGLTALVAAGAAMFTAFAMAGTAAAAPTAPAYGWGPGVTVQEMTSGNFTNNQDVLTGWIVPGSVSVVATQGQPPGQDPPVTTFGPGTGYTVSSDWHTVTLQPPYAGSNDGFVTYYAVFVQTGHFTPVLTTNTSGAFSNNQDILIANNIVPGSVFVVANQGQNPQGDNPSVNGFAQNNGYTVAYYRGGATVTLQAPYAGSNDGFVTYYTTYMWPVMRHPSVLTAAYQYGPWYNRTWLIRNVAGGRGRYADIWIYRYQLHHFVWLGNVWVPAWQSVTFTTHHGSLLRVGYWNGYGGRVFIYARA
ncbi:MAG TPA: hypothetical protein VLX31_18040 [Streptosporangiaceae bacterium]|nr:hypothetical protein [Streptosporangiaceae bacterium]